MEYVVKTLTNIIFNLTLELEEQRQAKAKYERRIARLKRELEIMRFACGLILVLVYDNTQYLKVK